MLARTTRHVPALDPALVAGYDAVLCDLDGCLVSDGRLLDGAAGFAAAAADRLWLVSNNSSDTADSLSARLAGMGLVIAPGRILLAGEQAVRVLAAERPGARLSLHAEEPIRLLADGLGLDLSPDRPDVVLLARDSRFAIAGLTSLLRAVRAGADLWVTNLDRTHPGADGEPVPETGALLAAVRACWPEVRYRAFGKPERALVDLALARAGVPADRSVFVGDNAETDGAAAAAAGIDFLHVAAPTLAPGTAAGRSTSPAAGRPESGGDPVPFRTHVGAL
ncbi:HAD-IIA family hydrolase [Polymorphum gilvum]|uniref:Haloacid dehalogenase-like hydrolase, putative n=1 Tax=Polymorphum gilvum (strain LMG 25793 / CGMCC 1.9160 / SL003B-26A1) TaxID=991905 RepID=F2IYY9_POLGS|nr:HAD family hydrolase [Polymorphum gilvum]ADZ70604.1 Haloacid dehalogenase-like hydrolase, putative [Polymorphum gilvum SL003B-26A1]